MNWTHVEDLIPAYALGALEADQRPGVEAHLDQCDQCARYARGHLEAAAALALAVPQAVPSPALRARILAGGESRTHRAQGVAERGERVGWHVRWPAMAMVAAAGLALVVLGALLGVVLDLRGELRNVRGELGNVKAGLDEQRTFTYTVALPGTETMMLEGADQGSRARGMLMASKDHTWALLVSQGLKPVHESMGYQVWLVKGAERMNGGVFTVDEAGYGQLFIKFPVPMDELTRIGVTLEPRGGSPAPTSSAVLAVNFQ